MGFGIRYVIFAEESISKRSNHHGRLAAKITNLKFNKRRLSQMPKTISKAQELEKAMQDEHLMLLRRTDLPRSAERIGRFELIRQILPQLFKTIVTGEPIDIRRMYKGTARV